MSDDSQSMTSYRPYLLRALHQWIGDNDMTPHLLVDAGQPHVQVPPQAISNGKVVLNIAGRAVVGLSIDNDAVSFTARFGGVSQAVWVPVSAVLAIYARETGKGMALPDNVGTTGPEDDPPTPPEGSQDDPTPPTKRGSHLRVVK